MTERDQKIVALSAAACVLIVLAGIVIGYLIKLVFLY
jgi:hypothetical protein